MRAIHILLAALILLAEAALGSVPGIIAVREGGMGLGSALIVGQASQVAGVAFGAIVAVHLIARRSLSVALVAGALLYYGGLIGVGHQPSHHLGWVVVILALAGVGMGMVLTAAFTAAATTTQRPVALAALLLAPLAASLLLRVPAFGAGPAALVVASLLVLAGALAVASATGESVPGQRSSSERPGSEARLHGRTALTAAALLGLGVVATLWGIEPSRVSATMVARSLGLPGLAPLDGLRLALLLGGLLLVGAGGGLLVARTGTTRATLLAAAASAAAALAGAGLLAIAGFSMPRELSPPDSGGGPVGELAAVAAGGAGLALGAWLLVRGTAPRAVATAGALVLGALSVVALFGAGALPEVSGAVGPLAAIALTAFGAGLTAVALRLVLATAPPGERALAAASGVAAAAVGAMSGLMIGAGEGMSRAIGVTSGMSPGSAVIVAAALVTVGIVVSLPRRAASEGRGRREPIGSAPEVEPPAA